MHVYIVSESGSPVQRHCTVLFSMTQTCVHPAHITHHSSHTKHAAIKGTKRY